MNTIYIIIFWFAVVNIIAFVAIAADKRKAINRSWRIPEKTFFVLALIGAAPGIYIGMLLFRHKTKHLSLMLGIPLIFIVQVISLVYFTFK